MHLWWSMGQPAPAPTACGVKGQRGTLQQAPRDVSTWCQSWIAWVNVHRWSCLSMYCRSFAYSRDWWPFPPQVQEEQIKTTRHEEWRMVISWELPSLLTSGGQKHELCRTCLLEGRPKLLMQHSFMCRQQPPITPWLWWQFADQNANQQQALLFLCSRHCVKGWAWFSIPKSNSDC